MRLRWLAALAATVALGGSAHAASYNLGALVSGGGSFVYNGLTFSDFSASSTGPAAVDINGLNVVTTVQAGGSGFFIAGSLTANGSDFGDLAISYTVTGSHINDAFLGTAGTAQGDSSYNVGETLIGAGGTVGTLSATNTSQSDHIFFAQQSSLTVLKDIGWLGNGSTPGVDLSIVSQTFSSPGPVPGAGYAGLLALALAGLYTRARRA
jgi:hypothetical protein